MPNVFVTFPIVARLCSYAAHLIGLLHDLGELDADRIFRKDGCPLCDFFTQTQFQVDDQASDATKASATLGQSRQRISIKPPRLEVRIYAETIFTNCF